MVEQVVDEDREAADVAAHAGYELCSTVVVDDRQQLDESLDRVQRGTQVVGQGGEERLASLLELLGLRRVASELGEADDRAAVVTQGGDRHLRPEPGAVLADAPAVVLRPPGCGGL